MSWPETRAWVGALALSGSAFWTARQLAVHVDLSPLVGYLIAFSCVVACVLLVTSCAPSRLRPCIAGAIAGLLLLVVSRQLRAASFTAAACVLLSLLLLGSALGTAIGLRVKQAGHLLFVAIVSGAADTWSVTQPGGISHVIAHAPVALSLLALPWPLPGTPDIVPLLGVGDVVFVALYVSATRALAMPIRLTLVAMSAGFVLTTVCVVIFERPIPVLPLLGICFVIAQPAARVVPPEDRRHGVWVLTVLVGALVAWFLRRS